MRFVGIHFTFANVFSICSIAWKINWNWFVRIFPIHSILLDKKSKTNIFCWLKNKQVHLQNVYSMKDQFFEEKNKKILTTKDHTRSRNRNGFFVDSLGVWKSMDWKWNFSGERFTCRRYLIDISWRCLNGRILLFGNYNGILLFENVGYEELNYRSFLSLIRKSPRKKRQILVFFLFEC